MTGIAKFLATEEAVSILEGLGVRSMARPIVTKPHCCYDGCTKDAEFSIHGQHGFEDVTEACEAHVGALLALLGYPLDVEAKGYWNVYPL